MTHFHYFPYFHVIPVGHFSAYRTIEIVVAGPILTPNV